jgi:hypothetical protein
MHETLVPVPNYEKHVSFYLYDSLHTSGRVDGPGGKVGLTSCGPE